MTAPDTARRERASKWFQEDPTMTRYQAYLAGAREEAARAAEKLREAARRAREGHPLSPVTFDLLADEIEGGQ